MDLIDRLREYASTRKGELAELITEAADALERQTCEDACDTCKHGYFGDRQCDNCRMRYPSHYEREEEHHD